MKNAAHPSYCHCCELCALKQKPGVLLDKKNFFFNTIYKIYKNTKSQLQTVLITASGPQALNALVHRKRYTQGSRQNRCVSSQDALALRARVSGTGEASSPFTQPSLSAVKPPGSLTLTYDCCCWTSTTNLRLGQTSLPLAPRVWEQSCARKNCQLRTAYGGESNCIIKT